MTYSAHLDFDSENKLPRGIAQLQFNEQHIQVTAGLQNIALEYGSIIGVQHVASHDKPSCYGKWSLANSAEYLDATDLISSQPTGFYMLFMLQSGKRKPKLRRVNIMASSIQVKNYNQEATTHVNELQQRLGYSRMKRLLFISNPTSGRGKSVKILREIIVPILKMAGVHSKSDFQYTTHRGHATEMVLNLNNILDYSTVATISGDGTFHEMLNGFLSRTDWKQYQHITLGAVGAGSANAIGKNTGTMDPASAILAILKQNSMKADIFAYIQENVISYSHLNVLWAFIADIDIESEKWRSLGEFRFILAALQRLFKFRNYSGTLYLLEPGDCPKYEIPPTGRVGTSGIECRYIKPGSEYQKWPSKLDSKFQYFVASSMPWISGDFLSSPDIILDDGLIDVQYGIKMSRTAVLPVILDQSTGNHVDLPFIERRKVKAFALEPRGHDSNVEIDQLMLDISGEKVAYKPIQVEVIEKAINLIVPQQFNKLEWMQEFQSKRAH